MELTESLGGNYASLFGEVVTYELSAAGPGTVTTTALPLLTATCTDGLATLTFAAQAVAPYAVGAVITVAGITGETSYNGIFTVTDCTASSVSYTLPTVKNLCRRIL